MDQINHIIHEHFEFQGHDPSFSFIKLNFRGSCMCFILSFWFPENLWSFTISDELLGIFVHILFLLDLLRHWGRPRRFTITNCIRKKMRITKIWSPKPQSYQRHSSSYRFFFSFLQFKTESSYNQFTIKSCLPAFLIFVANYSFEGVATFFVLSIDRKSVV